MSQPRQFYVVSGSAPQLVAVKECFPDDLVAWILPGKTGGSLPVGAKAALEFCAQRLTSLAEFIGKNPLAVFVVVKPYETEILNRREIAVVVVSSGGLRSRVETAGSSVRILPDYAHPHDDTLISCLKEAVAEAVRQLDDPSLALGNMDVYHDYPKAGVEFQDMFSLFAPETMHAGLYRRMADAGKWCSALVPFDYVVGIESRGLVLGMCLAALLNKPFVPLRKRDKLPRDKDHPIASASYATEYSSDTLELQARHVAGEKKTCMLVDDIVATGGSLCAALDLLAGEGVETAHIVVLRDVPELRLKWVEKLSHFPRVFVHFII